MRAYLPAAVLALSAALAACSRSENKTTDSAGGNVAAASATVDTGLANAATPIAGGTAQITPTDQDAARDALEYRLTDDNFRKFIAASDSLLALRRRDPQVNALFDKQVSDAGVNTVATTDNAGVKRLRDNPRINNAIVSAGMSAKDYFVAAVAVAQAERFMGAPSAAPPTPALPANARFLQQHRAELSALHTLEQAANTPTAPVTGPNAPTATSPGSGADNTVRP